MTNELKIGDRRHGGLFDENPDTPDISATVERSEDGIYVSMHWDSGKNPEYGRWFTNDAFYPDQDPDQTLPEPECPSELIFRDSHGPITLLGCRSDGYDTNLFIGTGRISVGAAILGASSLSYAKINGLQCEVSGLRFWLGTTSIRQTHSFDDETGMQQISIKLLPPEPITIPDSGLTLRPTYTKSRTLHSLEIGDSVRLEHRTENEATWHTHFGALRALRDLLAVSRWRSESLIAERVMRSDDPVQGLTGSVGTREQWLDVIDNTSSLPKEDTSRTAHLIEYAELGPDGISRWIQLREDFSRAFDPAVSSLYLANLSTEVRLSQVAIGLEALGYLIAVRDDGISESTANRMNFRTRLDRIVQDLDGVLPFVEANANWSQDIADAYNALKHVNRAAPQPVDIANGWRECVLLFRAWIASELGVDHAVLTQRILEDTYIRPFVAIERI
ncbi:HEPN domain-containing protein [Arthrobacter sp. KN11-1C]|uniref:ApeA N-terminal domain 1-containing protein n=1 Tax=Arthrobacter sp. KN11-1C TaxID=3445774 RepID=UPI003F9F276A